MRMPALPTVGPNFFVIGAQRSGTTRICELLSRHPQIVIPTKEPAYFQSLTDMMEKRSWYGALFSEFASVPRRGDGSTYYSMCGIFPGTAERIQRVAPEALILYFVRHPLERIESAWAQLLSVGHANSFIGFERTLRETPLLIDPSLYWRQLNEYRPLFGDGRIRLGFFEDFVRDQASELRSCFEFLGVDPAEDVFENETQQTLNATAGKRQRLRSVDAVRTMPGYPRLKRYVPGSLKALFTERITRPVPDTVTWSSSVRQWTIGRLAEDSARLLQHAGRAPDYWSFE